jgi:hypothetical protein
MRYCASDYGGFEAGRYSFYYGYEETICYEHTDCDNNCEKREWAFVVAVDKRDVFRIGSSKLETDCYNIAECLLDGIRQFIKSRDK